MAQKDRKVMTVMGPGPYGLCKREVGTQDHETTQDQENSTGVDQNKEEQGKETQHDGAPEIPNCEKILSTKRISTSYLKAQKKRKKWLAPLWLVVTDLASGRVNLAGESGGGNNPTNRENSPMNIRSLQLKEKTENIICNIPSPMSTECCCAKASLHNWKTQILHPGISVLNDLGGREAKKQPVQKKKQLVVDKFTEQPISTRQPISKQPISKQPISRHIFGGRQDNFVFGAALSESLLLHQLKTQDLVQSVIKFLSPKYSSNDVQEFLTDLRKLSTFLPTTDALRLWREKLIGKLPMLYYLADAYSETSTKKEESSPKSKILHLLETLTKIQDGKKTSEMPEVIHSDFGPQTRSISWWHHESSLAENLAERERNHKRLESSKVKLVLSVGKKFLYEGQKMYEYGDLEFAEIVTRADGSSQEVISSQEIAADSGSQEGSQEGSSQEEIRDAVSQFGTGKLRIYIKSGDMFARRLVNLIDRASAGEQGSGELFTISRPSLAGNMGENNSQNSQNDTSSKSSYSLLPEVFIAHFTQQGGVWTESEPLVLEGLP